MSDSASDQKLEVVVVTGLSGAGKTTAVNALEDLGYFCVDNLPTPVVPATLDALRAGGDRKVALGIDVRGRAYLEGAAKMLKGVASQPGVALSILFVDAPEELLARRFSATRRPHPLSTPERTGQSVGVRAVMDGIRLERKLLSDLRGMASVLIDTAGLSVHDLRREVVKSFSEDHSSSTNMIVRIVSFGFKFGAPSDADLVFDVRFLPNPYFVAELRPLAGTDSEVARYVLGNPDATGFLELLYPLLKFCLPRYRSEGKSYVTVAIGCTGGRHRSVALTEEIAARLSEELGFGIDAVHRDIRQSEHIAEPEPSSTEMPTDGSEKQ